MNDIKKSKFKRCPKCKTETALMICTCGYPLYKDIKNKIKKAIKK